MFAQLQKLFKQLKFNNNAAIDVFWCTDNVCKIAKCNFNMAAYCKIIYVEH